MQTAIKHSTLPLVIAAAACIRPGFRKNEFRESNSIVKNIVNSLGDIFRSFREFSFKV
jgi:hypothetical protein